MWTYPTDLHYKQRDHSPKDIVGANDLVRTNWIDAEYDLLGTIDSLHTGDDIVGYLFNCYGLNVKSIYSGTVILSADIGAPKVPGGDPTSTWRQLIVIQHTLPDGKHIYSRYAHLKDRLVKVGDSVLADQIIGHIGNAEGRLANHLHFDICLTDLLLNDPTNWPSTRHTIAQAKIIIDANYTDPKLFLDEMIRKDAMEIAVKTVQLANPLLIQTYSGPGINFEKSRILHNVTSLDIDVDNKQWDEKGQIWFYPDPTGNWLAGYNLDWQAAALTDPFVGPDIQTSVIITRYTHTPGEILNIRKTPASNGLDLGDIPNGSKVMVEAIPGNTSWFILHDGNPAWFTSKKSELGYVAAAFLVPNL